MMTPARPAIVAVLGPVLAGVLLAMSGCSVSVAGADGNLIDDWQPMATPRFEVPSVGTCLGSPMKIAFDPAFVRASPIECDRGHTLEVVLVGTVEGDAAQAPEPPAPGTEAYKGAYAACGAAASDYVGGDWHTGMLGINMQLPTKLPWAGGLKSYVCSIFTLSSAYGRMTFAAASLKGTLAGAAPKAMRCLEVKGTKGSDGWWDEFTDLTPIDCVQPHEAEFVGNIELSAAGAMPSAESIRKASLTRCWTVAARYLGLTDDQMDARNELGAAWDGMEKFQWDAGDRHERCFVVFRPGSKVRASVKGLGKKPLPV